MPWLGAASLSVAFLSLCAGGLRVVRPEAILGEAALEAVLERPIARAVFYGSLAVWMAIAIAVGASGTGLLLSQPWGRRVGLVAAWSSVVAFVAVVGANLAAVLPSLDASSLSLPEVAGLLAAGPSSGCCPVLFSLAMIAALHHEKVTAWARPRTDSIRPDPDR